MSDTLIKVENVSKKFCRSLKTSLKYGIQDIGSELLGYRHGGNGELRPGEFWALNDISFELKRGECLGLIGHNGAGKTTLLRMLNGLIKPDAGRIEMRGRIGALIALGAGFSPVLTGRENIYVNASILGIRKEEVDRKMNDILEFAEIGEFIDAPVQTYSSGMNVRLGFAIAAILIEPDILFLDEVLAVGDIGFAIKCLNAVRRITSKAAVVFVSHNMQYISSFCTRVLVVKHGNVVLDSPNPAEGIDLYYGLLDHGLQTSGTGAAQVLSMDLMIGGEKLPGTEPIIPQGSAVSVALRLQLDETPEGAHMLINIHDEAMAPLICMPVHDSDGRMQLISSGEHFLEIPLGSLELNSGKYSFVVVIRTAESSTIMIRAQGLCPFRIFSPLSYWGKIVRPAIANR